MALSSPLDDASIDPQVRSFFRTIKENPDDDTPRLIFADWLQERGDTAASARGEFLCLNVLRHRLSYDDPDHDALKRREAEIVKQYQWEWLGPLPDVACWSYQRGMIQLTARAEKILTTEITRWARSDAALWINALVLTDIDPEAEQVFQLARSPLLGHLNRLDLSSNRLRSRCCPFVQARYVPFLTELKLARNHLTANHIACVVRCRPSRRLTLLDLRYNRLDDVAARLLVESPHLKNLATLRLGINRFTAEGIALLRQAFGERVHF